MDWARIRRDYGNAYRGRRAGLDRIIDHQQEEVVQVELPWPMEAIEQMGRELSLIEKKTKNSKY